jgi:heme A synthase
MNSDESGEGPHTGTRQDDAGSQRDGTGWRRLAKIAAIVSYLLIVLGGVVRITGSGLGCGDDWPLCNGQLIPPLDLPTLIEYGHRLVAAAVSILVATLAVWAWRRRAASGWSRRARLATWALGLLIVQVMLGAVTVWLELPSWSVILHLATAMSLLAVLLIAALGRRPGVAPTPGVSGSRGSLAWTLTGLGAAVVVLGALVANLDAAPACQGFPLCNGRWLPGPSWRVQLHWLHRFAAYVLIAGSLTLPWLAARVRSKGGQARTAAWIVAATALAQLIVAAAMVLRFLPDDLRALHVALGTAVFAALLAHAWLQVPGTRAAGTRAPG